MLHPTRRCLYGYLRVTIINQQFWKIADLARINFSDLKLLIQFSKEFNIGEYNCKNGLIAKFNTSKQ